MNTRPHPQILEISTGAIDTFVTSNTDQVTRPSVRLCEIRLHANVITRPPQPQLWRNGSYADSSLPVH